MRQPEKGLAGALEIDFKKSPSERNSANIRQHQ